MARIALVVAAVAVVSLAAWMGLRGSGLAPRAREIGARSESPRAATGETSDSAATRVPEARGLSTSRATAGVSADRLICGRVVDRGGIPVNHASVRVELVNSRDEGTYAAVDAFETTVRVDTDARFVAVVPRNGRYGLAARAAGFGPVRRDDLDPGSDVEIVLDVPCRVTGRVVDAGTGKPIGGAPMRLASWEAGLPFDHGLLAVTGSDGSYAFEDAPSGSVTIYVLREGYLASSARAELKLDCAESKVRDFELGRGLAISGRVLDRDTGRPIAGATFEGWETLTDADGAFTLSGLESGEVSLKPHARGWLSDYLNVRVSARRRLDDLEIRLRRAAVLAGVVLDAEGAPVAGATVSRDRESETTAADGSFRISLRVAAGSTTDDCTLWIWRDGHDSFPVDVSVPVESTPVVIRLAPEDATVSGTVRTTDGRPIAGARVEIRGSHFRRLVESDDRGAFSLTRLPRSSSFLVSARARGFDSGEVSVLDPEGPDSAKCLEVVLKPEGTWLREEAERAARAPRGEDPKPQPRGRLRGRVIDAVTGQPLAVAASLVLYATEQGRLSVASGNTAELNCDFEFEAPVGEFWLEAHAWRYALSERRTFVIAEGAVTDAGTIALVRGAGIEGLVVPASGETSWRLGVVISKPDGRGFDWAGWTDRTGWYELVDVAPGDWLVYGAEEWWDSRKALVHLSPIGSAHVDSGGIARVDGKMAAPASLVVEAATGPGAAKVDSEPSLTSECDPNRFDFDHLEGAFAVVLHSKAGLPFVWHDHERSSSWLAAVWRVESAKVELPVSHLAPGEYVVKVQRNGVVVERTVRLEAGEQKRVVLELGK